MQRDTAFGAISGAQYDPRSRPEFWRAARLTCAVQHRQRIWTVRPCG